MGLFRLIVIAVIVIGAVMYWFGRDEGLPENRLGYEPEPVATEETISDTADATTGEAAQPAEAPDAQPATSGAADAPDAGETELASTSPEAVAPDATQPDRAEATAPEAGSDTPSEAAPQPADIARPALTLPAGMPMVIPGVPADVLLGPQGAGTVQTTAQPAPQAQPAAQPEAVAQPAPEPQPEPPVEIRYVAGALVNLREASSTGTPIVAKLPRGTEVELIGPAPDEGWSEVRVIATGDRGFIATRFLAEAPPAP